LHVARVSQALLGLKGKYDAIEEKAFHKDPTFHKVINHVWPRHPGRRALQAWPLFCRLREISATGNVFKELYVMVIITLCGHGVELLTRAALRRVQAFQDFVNLSKRSTENLALYVDKLMRNGGKVSRRGYSIGGRLPMKAFDWSKVFFL
jgi:hypothetical protein